MGNGHKGNIWWKLDEGKIENEAKYNARDLKGKEDGKEEQSK